MNPLLRLCYNLVFPVVILALLPGFAFRMLKRGNYRHKFGQRFAIYSRRVRVRLRRLSGRCVWVHAVSVGEVLIALKFIEQLRKTQPELPIVLSTTTSTGYALASRHPASDLEVIYHPVDFWLSTSSAMSLIRPLALIMVEAEIWPNLTHAAKAQGARLALINARLSPRSERRYRRVRSLIGGLFRQLDWVGLQDAEDVERFTRLGARPEALQVTGSIKFDPEGDAPAPRGGFEEILSRTGGQGRPILLAGSTHPGEEKILGRVYQSLRKEFPELFLVVVPRHAERRRSVLADLESLGLRVSLRSHPVGSTCDVLVIDTTGELRRWYAEATVVFVGKSITSPGGQNPAEAVSANKPVVFGPHMENFQQLTRTLLRNQGAIQVSDEAGLEQALRRLLRDPNGARQMASAATLALAVHRGATELTVQGILRLLHR